MFRRRSLITSKDLLRGMLSPFSHFLHLYGPIVLSGPTKFSASPSSDSSPQHPISRALYAPALGSFLPPIFVLLLSFFGIIFYHYFQRHFLPLRCIVSRLKSFNHRAQNIPSPTGNFLGKYPDVQPLCTGVLQLFSYP